ncbi:hypothetical protein [Luteimonas salinilitoris]|uniref:DUF3558 domain-containing protein n=1 Tax=Luteimonas salinilitoris TaxID=3237697 RepID=A0ABV4HMX2_9GAMM
MIIVKTKPFEIAAALLPAGPCLIPNPSPIMPTLFKLLPAVVLVFSLAACDSGGDGDGDIDDGEIDVEIDCEAYPGFPGCGSKLRPGFAKFSLGAAEAVRWAGNDGCMQLDFRTGRHGDENKLTKVEGEVTNGCNNEVSHFEFVYRQSSRTPGKKSWTTAYRPLNEVAAADLLDSCTQETRPDPSVAVGHWWEANNTYAENPLLGIIAPVAYATKLIPFDDDGFERVGEETIDGVETVHFRNERASVWLIAGDDRDRPVRATDDDGSRDMRFTEWDAPFAAQIPEELRRLEQICTRN